MCYSKTPKTIGCFQFFFTVFSRLRGHHGTYEQTVVDQDVAAGLVSDRECCTGGLNGTEREEDLWTIYEEMNDVDSCEEDCTSIDEVSMCEETAAAKKLTLPAEKSGGDEMEVHRHQSIGSVHGCSDCDLEKDGACVQLHPESGEVDSCQDVCMDHKADQPCLNNTEPGKTSVSGLAACKEDVSKKKQSLVDSMRPDDANGSAECCEPEVVLEDGEDRHGEVNDQDTSASKQSPEDVFYEDAERLGEPLYECITEECVYFEQRRTGARRLERNGRMQTDSGYSEVRQNQRFYRHERPTKPESDYGNASGTSDASEVRNSSNPLSLATSTPSLGHGDDYKRISQRYERIYNSFGFSSRW